MSFYLFIMRHAKSDWSSPGTSDFDRPINKRGHKNARRIGEWMQQNTQIPEKIVCSPALRAKQTIENVLGQLITFNQNDLYYDKDLYLADLDTLLECIQLYKNDVNSLMLIAHNPGLDYLVDFLADKSIEPDKQGKTVTTANLIIFEFAHNNFDPEIDKGKLIEFIKPKQLD